MSVSPGIHFQNDIRRFLANVGFAEVPRPGDQLILGGQEIDAFGRHKGFFVVVDAKTKLSLASRQRSRNVRSYLSIINGYKNEVIEDIKEKYEELHGYSGTVFVFWTKNLRIKRKHKERAGKFRIALRDGFDLKYYEEAHRILANKDIITNCFLKDLLLQLPGLPIFTEKLSINAKAIKTTFGAKTLYMFPIEVEDLLKFAYVFRVELNSILGESYQRLLKEKKVRNIGTYLREGGYFPNNLIAISEEQLEFTPEEGEKPDALFIHGELQLPNKPCYLEILDGQHRLYGYSSLSDIQDHCLWVTIVEGLSPVDKAKLFVKINKTQTPVPSDILWDLYQITEPTSIRGKISKFVYELNEKHPLQDLISLPRVRSLRAYLSFSNFCYSLGTRSRLFSQFGHESSFMNTITAYLAEIKKDPKIRVDWNRSVKHQGKKGFILTNNSISVILRLLTKVLRRTKIPSNERIESWRSQLDDWVVPPIRTYLQDNEGNDRSDPYQSMRRDLTSEGARKYAAQAIWERSPLSDQNFAIEY